MEEESIPEVIENIVRNFVNNANIRDFLTEDDLRCHLFSELKVGLAAQESTSLHAEVRWYGSVNPRGLRQLQYRSDIVVIDRESLENPVGEIFTLPSKGYAFDNYFAVVEIKLRRPNNRENDAKYFEKVEADILKLEEIRQRTSDRNEPVFISIYFDKKQNRKHAWLISSGNKRQSLIAH